MNFVFVFVCGKHVERVFLVEFFKHCENDCPVVLQKCQKTCAHAVAVNVPALYSHMRCAAGRVMENYQMLSKQTAKVNLTGK